MIQVSGRKEHKMSVGIGLLNIIRRQKSKVCFVFFLIPFSLNALGKEAKLWNHHCGVLLSRYAPVDDGIKAVLSDIDVAQKDVLGFLNKPDTGSLAKDVFIKNTMIMLYKKHMPEYVYDFSKKFFAQTKKYPNLRESIYYILLKIKNLHNFLLAFKTALAREPSNQKYRKLISIIDEKVQKHSFFHKDDSEALRRFADDRGFDLILLKDSVIGQYKSLYMKLVASIRGFIDELIAFVYLPDADDFEVRLRDKFATIIDEVLGGMSTYEKIMDFKTKFPLLYERQVNDVALGVSSEGDIKEERKLKIFLQRLKNYLLTKEIDILRPTKDGKTAWVEVKANCHPITLAKLFDDNGISKGRSIILQAKITEEIRRLLRLENEVELEFLSLSGIASDAQQELEKIGYKIVAIK
ncbi:MAG: hypothetical protein HY072_04570 [Deltaproteobacteria bacterium]|nr:hypothetical protein [Deltaproteobacteria bacterium]